MAKNRPKCCQIAKNFYVWNSITMAVENTAKLEEFFSPTLYPP